MTKQDTNVIKGIAILMMLFLHLFNENGVRYDSLVLIDGVPLVSILAKATYPVGLFLLVGGYGLYKAYEKGDSNRWSRILRLMLHYWIITFIFVAIGSIIKPGRYPGSWGAILSNFTGFCTTYNAEMWFLLPYVILTACARPLFSFLERFRAPYVVIAFLFLHLITSYGISRYGTKLFYNNYWIYTPWLVLHISFNFCLGAMCARTGILDKIKAFPLKPYVLRCLGIILLIAFVTYECIGKYNLLYSLGILVGLLCAGISGWPKNMLMELGRHSMNMWMIHSWFCYYLFSDFIMWFRYPMLIFVVLVLISYLCSRIANRLIKPIETIVFRDTTQKLSTKYSR